MKYDDVLALTPRQIQALASEKSMKPGYLNLEERNYAIKDMRQRLGLPTK